MDLVDGRTLSQRVTFLRLSATELRRYAADLDRAILTLVWQSFAATRCKSDLTGCCTNLRRLAGVLDDTADALAAHAATARRNQQTTRHVVTETVKIASRVAEVVPLGVLL